MATTATPKKPVLKFPRNQCIACNNNILDRYHPVLLFGKRKEAGDLRSKFERFTTISLKEDDSYLKKICLRCKVKLDSAVCFKEMCLLSRRNQEENLSRVKRGRPQAYQLSLLSRVIDVKYGHVTFFYLFIEPWRRGCKTCLSRNF